MPKSHREIVFGSGRSWFIFCIRSFESFESTWSRKKGWMHVRSQQKHWRGSASALCRLQGRARGAPLPLVARRAPARAGYSIHSRFLASAARTADNIARRVAFPMYKKFFNSFRSVIWKVGNNKSKRIVLLISNNELNGVVNKCIDCCKQLPDRRVAEHKNKLSSRVSNGPRQ